MSNTRSDEKKCLTKLFRKTNVNLERLLRKIIRVVNDERL